MQPPKTTISLITYNIHKGFGLGKLRFLLPQMREAITALNPDFVFLQEVQGAHSRRQKRIESWPDTPQFEYLAENMWPHYVYAKNAVYQSGHHGNAILSKYPKGSRYLVIDFVRPWTKSTRQRAKLKGRDRPASATLR